MPRIRKMINKQKQTKSIAVMQPTFLPWLGYFSLINSVDEFIFLDHVQFEKRSWQQRNRIRTFGSEMWLSVPVLSKGKQLQSIKNVEILYEGNRSPLLKIMKSIELNYKKTPFYIRYADELNTILLQNPRYLSELNQLLIRWICDKLEITTSLRVSSDLNVEGSKAKLLVNICESRGATHYLSPPGSKIYLDETSTFDTAGIQLEYFDYRPKQYTQIHGDFIPYMSVIDALFNVGPNSLKTLIMKGY